MEYVIIAFAAFITSGLTFFSGFGLGTLLLPVFALFSPVHAAVVLTAVVHLLNNLFKLVLLGKYAEKSIILQFGAPAILAAFPGAWVLLSLSNLAPLAQYHLGERQFQILPVKLVVALLIVIFALFELIPTLAKISFEKKYLPLGGILSGFFGGLSGHQGALRSAFLLKCGLSKEGFLGTGIVIACLVDLSRISVYAANFGWDDLGGNGPLLSVAVVSAFLGAFFGNRLVQKVTMRMIQTIVSILLFAIAMGLGAGIL